MIQPVFFPFVHMTQTDVDMMLSAFEQFVFLPACAEKELDSCILKAMEKESAVVRFPDPGVLGPVVQQAKGYKELARMNRGGKTGLREFLRMGPFLKSDTFVSGIRSEIENRAGQAENCREQAGEADCDLLFLNLSGMFDMEKRSLERELASVRAAEKRLFAAMKGEEGRAEPPGAQGDLTEDLGEYMTQERIEAWARYSGRTLADGEPGESPVYMTTSPAVFDYMISSAESEINILDIDNFRVHEEGCENQHQWKKDLNDCIERLLEAGGETQGACLASADDGCGKTFKLRLRLLQGGDAVNIFKSAGESLPVGLIEK
ncbi:MAG: hypothetical protein R6V41_03230 [Desulfobacteraceae bacterium]